MGRGRGVLSVSTDVDKLSTDVDGFPETFSIVRLGLVHLKGLPLTSLAIPNDAKTDLGLKHYLAALETHSAIHDVSVGRGRIRQRVNNC